MIIHQILTLQLPNWDIPWAGIGGFLLGVGSALSGYAAIISARNTIKKTSNEDTEEHPNA